MAGFTKLHECIIRSSIWSQDHVTRIVWVTFLAMADRSGNVIGVRERLAASANVSIEEYDRAIEKLSSPDPESKTPDHEGRRIIPIPGGWHLVNYAKYRANRDPEKRRKQNREAKRRQREREKKRQQNVSQCQPNAEAEADIDRAQAFSLPPDLEIWKGYAVKIGLTEAEAQRAYDHFGGNGWERSNGRPIKSWDQIPHLLTYWRNNRGRFDGGTDTNELNLPPVSRGADGKTPRERILSNAS